MSAALDSRGIVKRRKIHEEASVLTHIIYSYIKVFFNYETIAVRIYKFLNKCHKLQPYVGLDSHTVTVTHLQGATCLWQFAGRAGWLFSRHTPIGSLKGS